jgi:hypothetical protein
MAQHANEARQIGLLDLPDTVLERILVAASDGGDWLGLRKARRACSRLRAVAAAATRQIRWTVPFWRDGFAELSLLPRLGGLERVLLCVSSKPPYNINTVWSWSKRELKAFQDTAQEVADCFCE